MIWNLRTKKRLELEFIKCSLNVNSFKPFLSFFSSSSCSSSSSSSLLISNRFFFNNNNNNNGVWYRFKENRTCFSFSTTTTTTTTTIIDDAQQQQQQQQNNKKDNNSKMKKKKKKKNNIMKNKNYNLSSSSSSSSSLKENSSSTSKKSKNKNKNKNKSKEIPKKPAVPLFFQSKSSHVRMSVRKKQRQRRIRERQQRAEEYYLNTLSKKKKKELGLMDIGYEIDISQYHWCQDIIAPNILYTDDHVIVLHKLAGIQSLIQTNPLKRLSFFEKQSQLQLQSQQTLIDRNRFMNIYPMVQDYIRTDKELSKNWRLLAQQALEHNKKNSISTVEENSMKDSEIDIWIMEAEKLKEKYKKDKTKGKIVKNRYSTSTSASSSSSSSSSSTVNRFENKESVEIMNNRSVEKDIVPYVGAVHRLDRLVSGVLLFTRHEQATREFVKLFSEGKVNKYYVAIVKGIPNWNEELKRCETTKGILEHYIATKTGYYSKIKVLSKSYVDQLLQQLHPKNNIKTNKTNTDKLDTLRNSQTSQKTTIYLNEMGELSDVLDSEETVQDELSQNDEQNVENAHILSITQHNATNQTENKKSTSKKKAYCFQYAKLKYEILDTFTFEERDYSVLKIQPSTGQQDQIRAQLAHEKFPIVGDVTYRCKLPFVTSKDWERTTKTLKLKTKRHTRKQNHNGLEANDKIMGGPPIFVGKCQDLIALHAWIIEYQCPFTQQLRSIESPIPLYWSARFGLPVLSKLFDHF